MWNYMQIEVTDSGARPEVGPGGMTRNEAITQVQQGLDNIARTRQAFARVANAWRAGPKDHTLSLGPIDGTVVVWTVYEYPNHEDPTYAAMRWLEDWSAAAGLPARWTP